MSNPGNTLVFDVGTSGLKTVLFDPAGAILATKEVGFETQNFHRQSPSDWWNAACEASKAMRPENVVAIALTGTMENLIPVTGDGEQIGDALLYSDPCGADARASLEKSGFGKNQFAAIAGNAAEPLMSVFKLIWLRNNNPEKFAAVHWFLPGSKDYLALKMTGRAVTDATCAATTGLLDFANRDWSDELLSHFEISRDQLPEVLPAHEIVGQLSPRAAEELSLSSGIAIINGCGDAGATTLGGGATEAGDVSLYLGTSGWAARVVPSSENVEPRPFYRLPHPLEKSTIEIAPILSAGAATNWARDTVGLDLEQSEKRALEADRQPGEAIFLPYLSGERFPFLDLDLRAGFLNVSANDGPGQLYYAVLEGVAFSIKANIVAMGGAKTGEDENEIGKISLVGGGALSKIWPQIIADILNTPIEMPNEPLLATSLGAFRIACKSLGRTNRSFKGTNFVHPRADRQQRIRKLALQFDTATRFARSLS